MERYLAGSTYCLFGPSAVEFQDVIAMKYCGPLLRMPSRYDGCGGRFSLGHTLDCKNGRLVTQRHNEVGDALGDIAALTYKEVVRESLVREADENNGIPALVVDLGVRGVWQPQSEALFYLRVVVTDTQSSACRSMSAVLSAAEKEKKRLMQH